MGNYVLFRLIAETGKINKTLTGKLSAMLKLWALQNTSEKEETIIVDADTGNIIYWLTMATGVSAEESDCVCHCTEIGLPYDKVRAYFEKED